MEKGMLRHPFFVSVPQGKRGRRFVKASLLAVRSELRIRTERRSGLCPRSISGEYRIKGFASKLAPTKSSFVRG